MIAVAISKIPNLTTNFWLDVRKLRCILTFLLLMSLAAAYAQVNYKHFIIRARHDLSEGHFTDAMLMLNKAIESQPGNFEAFFLRGVAKYNLDDLNGARADFDKTLELHPLYIRALQYRGICNQRLENHDGALDDFAKVIEIDPFNAEVYSARAVTYLQIARYDDALNDNDMALSIKPKLVMALVNRGIAKSHLNRYSEAIDDLDEALKLDIFNSDIYFKRALVNARADSNKLAIKDLNMALKLDNDNPLYYFNRAVTNLHLGDTTAAMADYEIVNQLDKRNALTYFNRGILYAIKKDYGNALQMFDYVTQINPKNIYGYFNRSMVYCEMKRWSDAETDLNKVIQLKPDFVGAWINRAAVRYEKGDEKAASIDRRHALYLMTRDEKSNADSKYQQYADSAYISKIISFESDFVNSANMLNLPQYANAEIVLFPDFVLTVIPNDEYVFIDGKKRFYINTELVKVNETLPFKLAVQNSNNSVMPAAIAKNDFSKADDDMQRLLKAMLLHRDAQYAVAKKLYSSISTGKYRIYGILNLSAMLYEEMMGQSEQPGFGQTPTYQGKFDNIIDMLSNALSVDDKNPYVWFNLGNMHLRNKEYNRAIDDYSKAIAFNPDLAEAYYNRALTLVFIGEEGLAAADLSRAGELGVAEAYQVLKRYTGK